jgi:hypothetical protein
MILHVDFIIMNKDKNSKHFFGEPLLCPYGRRKAPPMFSLAKEDTLLKTRKFLMNQGKK